MCIISLYIIKNSRTWFSFLIFDTQSPNESQEQLQVLK